MKIILYILFILSFGFLLFKLPHIYTKKKLFITLGLGLAFSFVLLIIGYFCFLLYSSKVNTNLMIYEKQVINFFIGVISLFFFSLFIHFFTEIIFEKIIIGFHQNYNEPNVNKNPVKFVIEKLEAIKDGFKILFFLSGFLIYYGVVYDSN
jgi:hypothetical protein